MIGFIIALNILAFIEFAHSDSYQQIKLIYVLVLNIVIVVIAFPAGAFIYVLLFFHIYLTS